MQPILSGPVPLESRPLLSVQASASSPLDADAANLSLTVDTVKPTSDEAVRSAALVTQGVVSALRAVVAASSISTSEASLIGVHSVPPTPAPDDFHGVLLAYRARIAIDVNGVDPARAMTALRAGMASGATGATISLERKACNDALRELRARALRSALARASTIAARAGGRLGVLYRVKEEHSECPVHTEPIVSVQLRTRDNSAEPAPVLAMPELGAALPHRKLAAQVRMLLVYELASDVQAPSTQAPGEVHLGLTQIAHAGTNDVKGTVSIRARVIDADPTAALQKAGAIMDKVTQALRSDGLSDEELVAGTALIEARTKIVAQGVNLVRVPRDYIAESNITITTRRFPELGRWLSTAGRLGATGLEGPTYEMVDPEPMLDSALEFATTQIAADAVLMAQSAGQQLRAPTHVRMQGGWLSESDPLRQFIEELGTYTGYGRGAGGFHGRDAELKPDAAFPPVTILPPKLYAEGDIAIGFALQPNKAGRAN